MINLRNVRLDMIRYGIYGLLVAFMYHSSYSWLIGHDWPREDYNYCYLVPFVISYLIWEKKGEWSKAGSSPSWSGLSVLMAAVLL